MTMTAEKALSVLDNMHERLLFRSDLAGRVEQREALDFFAAMVERTTWRPIETAPKDGTCVLLFCQQGDGSLGSTYRKTFGHWWVDEGGIWERRDLDGRWIGQDECDGFEGWMSWDGGFSEDTMMPTHWMPLPANPEPQP